MKPELYWIEGPWRGRLAIAGRPRGGDWLEDDVRGWRKAGVDSVVSLLTTDEEKELALEQEARLSQAAGISFSSFPIADRSIPASQADAIRLIRDLEKKLVQGKNVALHCRQGIGRSALIGASLLVLTGLEPEAAFTRLAKARGCSVPETAEQRDWVTQLAEEIAPVRP